MSDLLRMPDNWMDMARQLPFAADCRLDIIYANECGAVGGLTNMRLERVFIEYAKALDDLKRVSHKTRHFDRFVDALSEIKASVDGLSGQSVKDIIAGLLAEIKKEDEGK